MKIIDPVLCPDISIYVDHINPQEFIDGGCESVVVGLYPKYENGKKVLDPISRKQCQDVAKSGMILQVYYWDDINLDPIAQADWLVQTIKTEGFPIKWVWSDQEQWWSDWNKWLSYRRREIPASQVPTATPANISSHNQVFMKRLYDQMPNSGVYTNNGFVASWASPMNAWLPLYRSWPAQYGRQPSRATQMSWAEFRKNWMPTYDLILAPGQLPDKVAGHQVTGDVCILPGSYNYRNEPMALDVSVFSAKFLAEISNGSYIPPIPSQEPPSVVYLQYRVCYARINVRSKPDSLSTWVRYAVLNEVVSVVNISNGWAQLADNTYVYAAYLQVI
jgi:hypothetical protein